ncbi:uncharacterized protein KY384_003937 [Bacidia gigantensis]|uniref:uncharacterized protein n=1 Tax=Bacidia gigantensis TaxID=2732470 RepID=UPI001D0473CB|nr:uncharacterized protein KY384_003937 [Bacidia gigantensis]KAG8532296.1 hypothetical protein KY384_003937 [Bacidia gigantensis]
MHRRWADTAGRRSIPPDDLKLASSVDCSMFDVVVGTPPQRIHNAGAPRAKRVLSHENKFQSYDWALCSLDPERIAVANGYATPGGKRIYPDKIAANSSLVTNVYVITASRELDAGPGDCGSWVLNAENGDFCGHIVAGVASSTRVYFITAEDILADISEYLQKKVTLPPPTNFGEPVTAPPPQERVESRLAQVSSHVRNVYVKSVRLFKMMCLAVFGGLCILLSVGHFIIATAPRRKQASMEESGDLMDCSTYKLDCSKITPQCRNTAEFDFHHLWNITTSYWQQCPDGPWLFEPKSPSLRTVQGQGLSKSACEAVAGVGWTKYPINDLGSHLAIWKLPLLQLIALCPQPPFSTLCKVFSTAHLLGDPIGTLSSLIHKLENCQQQAVHWQQMSNDYLWRHQERQYRSSYIDDFWKSCALIVNSYDEWGADTSDNASRWLEQEMYVRSNQSLSQILTHVIAEP